MNDLRARQGCGPLAGLPQFEDAVADTEGSTGQVFRARQPATDRWVAVKVFGPVGQHPATRRRFERELAITGRLSGHPYLIMILEHGSTPSGCPYLVMPWYDRGSLAGQLARHGPMAVPELLTVGIRIAAGLDHVHAHGVTHRDVKPSNILLSAGGGSVLADFGGSIGRRDPAGRDAGDASSYTPGHAAPELLRDEAAGPPADIWSLASTLYTALAGRRPFAGDTESGGLAGEIARTLHDPLPPLDRADVPPALSDLLAAGLAKRPGDRPTALELATALQGVQAQAGLPLTEIPGRGGAAPNPPTPRRPGQGEGDPATVIRAAPPAARQRRGPASTATIAAVASVGLAAAAVIVVAQVRAPQVAQRAPAATPSATLHAAPQRAAGDAAAAGLHVSGRRATSVDLAWRDTNAGTARYLVIVDPAPRGAGPVSADGPTAHTVGGLKPLTSYCFRVVTGDTEVAAVTAPVCAVTR